MNKLFHLVVLVVVLSSLVACGGSAAPIQPTVVPTASPVGLANPASTLCVEKGGKVNLITDASGGQIGMCVWPDGSQCEEWAFYRGQCKPLTLDALKNAEYQSEFPASKKAKLTDGKYEEAIVPGAASKLIITLYPIYAWGDLNGDGVADAVVILAANAGGSGMFNHLAAVVNQNGQPKHIASASLGDRVKIEAIKIEAGAIKVDLITHSPNDPLCCPTLKTTLVFKLQGDKLVESSTPTNSANSAIVNVTWKWERFEDTAGLNNVTVSDPSKYTLKLNADGTYHVKADCNTGGGKYTLEGSRLIFGPMALTRAACAPDSLSDKYVARLGDVATFVLKGDKLYLNLKMDSGNMVMAQ